MQLGGVCAFFLTGMGVPGTNSLVASVGNVTQNTTHGVECVRAWAARTSHVLVDILTKLKEHKNALDEMEKLFITEMDIDEKTRRYGSLKALLLSETSLIQNAVMLFGAARLTVSRGKLVLCVLVQSLHHSPACNLRNMLRII